MSAAVSSEQEWRCYRVQDVHVYDDGCQAIWVEPRRCAIILAPLEYTAKRGDYLCFYGPEGASTHVTINYSPKLPNHLFESPHEHPLPWQLHFHSGTHGPGRSGAFLLPARC